MVEDNARRIENRFIIDQQKKEQEQKEMPTFQPMLITQERSDSNNNRTSVFNTSNTHKNKLPKRKFNTFYKDQMDFRLKVENSIRNKRKNEEITTFIQAKYAQVKANKKSDQIIEKLKSTAITQEQ